MSGDILVTCENISKKFCRSLKRSLWYGVQDICSELTQFQKDFTEPDASHLPKLRKDEFWAVNNISFELKRGECLGLIGHNGAGKSTLLKMLYGLIKPDCGRITMRGRIGALIELNAGFSPILTGRENVYIYGSILGLTKKEIDRKYDAIVEFSEMSDFMEMPFRSYSSGMKVRLGFSVAAQMEPDVLIIDEVLAVGDVGFRAKCYNKIYEIIKNSAVIFVSHSMNHIDRTCTSAMLMKNGMNVIQSYDTARVISKYYSLFSINHKKIILNDDIQISNIQVNGTTASIHSMGFGEPLSISFQFKIPSKYDSLEFSLSCLSPTLEVVTHSNSRIENITIANQGREKKCQILIKKPNWGSGKKFLTLIIREVKTNLMLCWFQSFAEINIHHTCHIPSQTYLKADFTIYE